MSHPFATNDSEYTVDGFRIWVLIVEAGIQHKGPILQSEMASLDGPVGLPHADNMANASL